MGVPKEVDAELVVIYNCAIGPWKSSCTDKDFCMERVMELCLNPNKTLFASILHWSLQMNPQKKYDVQSLYKMLNVIRDIFFDLFTSVSNVLR